jgi:lipopolysaccharide transport system ATP-binding protein
MSSKNITIRVSHLSKQYRLGGPQEPYHTLRDVIVNSLKAPMKVFHKTPPVEGFWALKDVSFDVEQGEVIGIIGRNGAGKSTLLKILSRITAPTEGMVELHGRVGSLLEVGTGFHPEMTGRENVFLNGSILGMKKTEIEQKFDEIVKFAEIDKFIDTPVKRYSSGMYVRLAFAVAAHLEPEILIVDEVLAVGDIHFQKKCLGRMSAVSKEGRTVLFVSHDMRAIRELCKKTILLQNGNLALFESTNIAIDYYLQQAMKDLVTKIEFTAKIRKPLQILEAQITDNSGNSREIYDVSDRLFLHLKYRVNNNFRGMNIMILGKRNGTDLFCSYDIDSLPHLVEGRTIGDYYYVIEFPYNFLKAGRYSITLGTGMMGHEAYEQYDDIIVFEIKEISRSCIRNGYAEENPGAIIFPLTWKLYDENLIK